MIERSDVVVSEAKINIDAFLSRVSEVGVELRSPREESYTTYCYSYNLVSEARGLSVESRSLRGPCAVTELGIDILR